jgi:hypothetical protein
MMPVRLGRMAIALAWLGFLLLLQVAGPDPGRGADPRERTAPRGKTWAFSFATDTLGLPPAVSRVSSGQWAVLVDSTAALAAGVAPADSSAAPRILRQLESEDGIAHHALQFLKPKVADQETSVRFRIRSGDMNPSVGIAFHLDPKGRNGYLTRIDAGSGELIAHYLLSGKRRDLRFGRIEAPKVGEWHTLGIRRVGSVIEISYDGRNAMRLRDERFGSGNVGLWTEDDTVADFKDLTVRSL